MSLFAQLALGTNAITIALDQHADQQQKINRRTANRGVEIGEVVPQVTQIETSINTAQEMTCWDVVFKVERVKQQLLTTR